MSGAMWARNSAIFLAFAALATGCPQSGEDPTAPLNETPTPGVSPTETAGPTPTATAQTPTATPEQTATATPVQTATATPEQTATATPEQTATATPVQTATATPEQTPTPDQTPTATAYQTPSATQAPTPTADQTPSATQVPTPTATPAAGDSDGDGYAADVDCDDTDPQTYPGALELCDGVDNSCDGQVDNDPVPPPVPTLPGVCADALWTCAGAEGWQAPDYSQIDGYEDGEETLCDGLDNNCDGATDEALLVEVWADVDLDGAGDSGTSALVCELAEGQVLAGAAEDCDDTDAQINPGVDEICGDGVDNDCQGGDLSCDDVDDDGDGYTENQGDCDDTQADVGPEAAEICGDDTDNDCQGGDLSCDDADVDGDGYSVNQGDCDDGSPVTYPGGPEQGAEPVPRGDGLDNDCDGFIDEGLQFGAGIDGPITIAGADFADSEDVGVTCGPVASLAEASAFVTGQVQVSQGDKVLLINLGTTGSPERVGAWELLDVANINGQQVEFTGPVSRTYGASGNDDLSGQRIALFRVAQPTSLHVEGTLRVSAFNGSCGGVLPIMAFYDIDVSGLIDASAAGYVGGVRNTIYDSTGQQGESIAGTGTKTLRRNIGGGGGGGLVSASCTNCEGCGSGGGHGGVGEDGEESNPTISAPSEGGGTYGAPDLSVLTLGSGGGAGALDMPTETGLGGEGGSGGGVLLLFSPAIRISGLVSSEGEGGEVGCAMNTDWCGTANTGSSGSPSEGEPGGGGAGGSIYLVADSLQASPASVSALGGPGIQSGSSWAKWSGDGGEGRVRLDANLVNGLPATSDAEGGVTSVFQPLPGHISTP